MKKWWLIFLIFICWIFAGFTLDSLTTQNTLNISPAAQTDRIVSMAPNITEILYALGLEKEVVGVTNDSDYPPSVTEKTKVGTFWQPNIEAVVATRPNLVITLGFEQQLNLAARLERIGYRRLTLNIETVNEFFEAVEKIADTTNTQEQAEELLNNLKSKLDTLSSKMNEKSKKKVLWIVQREPLRVAGMDTFINEMIEMAGGQNAIGKTIYQYPPISSEQVIACNPDVIIEPAMGFGDLSQQQETAFEYWSKFQNVTAVAKNRIYVIEPDTVSRLGPRLYEGVESISKCLNPEVFEK